MSKISELSDGGSLVSSDYLIAVRSGGNVKVRMDQINVDQVDLGDNEFIRLGNSQDLTMVHTSTQSIINQAGTGDLLIQKAGATKLTINASGIDVTGSVTATGTSVFASLDISGDIDVDGTTNLDVVDIDGAVDMASTLAVGGQLYLGATSGGNGLGSFLNQGTGANFYEAYDGTKTMIAGTDASNAFVKIGSLSAHPVGFVVGNGLKFQIDTDGSLSTPTAGTSNVRFGVNAGNSIASGGSQNTLIGDYAGTAISLGDYNTAVGFSALYSNQTGEQNTAIGRASLYTNTGNFNTAVGFASLESNSTGVSNTAVGKNALLVNSTGTQNAAFGAGSLAANVSTSYNTALGAQAGRAVTGERNVYLGYDAGAGVASIATGNIIIGMESRPAATTGNYEIVIGYGTTGKGAQTGFINPIGGGVYQGNNSSTWSTTSDRRLKKNIADSTLGLAEINQIQVRNFEYRNEDEITELPASSVVKVEGVQIGVIAQEIQAILPDCVKEESTGVLSVDPNNLTWHMIKAIQELSAQNAALTARIAALEE